MRHSIGIDPGLGETGLVLCTEDARKEQVLHHWRTFSCPPGDNEDLTRVVSLASSVVDTVIEWIDEFNIRELDTCIELPVYKRNALTYTKQIRLLEEIESGLFFTATGLVDRMILTEVYPTTSKVLLTSNSRAKKPQMVEAFEKMTGWELDAPKATKEAVADAYAHSLACWIKGVSGNRLNMSELQAAMVEVRSS
jgi:Holliday junction resolvasome RuvABC endonuclease subunit